MKDQSKDRCCENCRFYYEEGRQCRRYPPTVYGCDEDNGTAYGFPYMRIDEWCGEFKIKG